tara:strand:+ start:6652 stop:6927 length:276 start_codon:yes stop_codon:yes gene_type:complete
VKKTKYKINAKTKYHRFNVDDLVVSSEQSRKLPKYIDVYDNDGNIVTAIQIHPNGVEDEHGNEIEMSWNDNHDSAINEWARRNTWQLENKR